VNLTLPSDKYIFRVPSPHVGDCRKSYGYFRCPMNKINAVRMKGTLFWTFGERYNWSFYCTLNPQRTFNKISYILQQIDLIQNVIFMHWSQHLIFDVTPFVSSRKQHTGSGSIIQSLFLPSIVCRHRAMRLARHILEIILIALRYWKPRLGIGL